MAGLTSGKAKEILRDKSVRGNPLTGRQKRFFGAVAGGEKPRQLAALKRKRNG